MTFSLLYDRRETLCMRRSDYHQNKTLPIVLIAVATTIAAICTSCKKQQTDEEASPFGSCRPVAPQGHLTHTAPSGPYTFRTSGGGTIVINEKGQIVITHANYAGFKLEFWGGDVTADNPTGKMSANHENLNGKHIKDRVGGRRTIIFPDGAKITFAAPLPNPAYPPLTFISIYDGAEVHRINPNCNTVEYSAIDDAMAQKLDAGEEDGETATFEFTSTGLMWVNIYTEDTPGSKVSNRVLLGELLRNSPSQVNDYYDDPRLGHT